MKKRVLTLLAIVALLAICVVFSVSANTQDVRQTFVCPCSTCVAVRENDRTYKCPAIDAWKSVSTTAGTTFENGGHYYVGADTTSGGQLTVPAGTEAVLLIDHATLRYEASSGRMINITGSNDSTEQSMSLHVIGNNDAFMQYKYKGTGNQGPMIQVGAHDIGHFHLYGDLTLSCEEGSTSATDGGVIKVPSKGRLYMHDNLNMGLANGEDPTIIGHTASGNGGAIYMQAGSSLFTMEAGTVQGGSAVNGGAISMAGGTVNLKAGNITGGIASSYGGAIYAEGGVVNIGMDTTNYPDGPTISGSTATSRGGGAYFAAGVQANMGSGSLSGCYAGSKGVGGAVYVRGENSNSFATFNMSGGTITVDGSKSSSSRGVRVQGGTFNMSGTATVVSAGGSESGAGIDCLGGKVSLDGAARIYTPDGVTPYDILVRNANSPRLTVCGTWTGSATVRFNKIVDDKSYAPGGTLGSYAVSTGDFTGQLRLQSEATLPRIYGVNGSLVFSNIAVHSQQGVEWFKNAAEAVANAAGKQDRYIKLHTDTLNLAGETVYVDFNGRTANVIGNGTVYGFDSCVNANGTGAAAVTAADATMEMAVANPVEGDSYVAITQNDVTTFHMIKPVVDAVSLRGSAAGMYYSGKVICDETLASYVTAYGIALSTESMPGEDFQSNSMYTRQTAAMTPGAHFYGVLVKDVLKENADNNSRAETAVYANAYVTVQIGEKTQTYLASDSGNAAGVSFKYVVNKTNAIYRTLDNAQKEAFNGLYTKYSAEMADDTWHTHNVAQACGEEAYADGVKILMIGNSLSVDAGRMLSYVFALEGYNNVRVSTLYKSGCKLYEHVSFLKNNEAAYTFYDNQYTDAAAVVANPALAKPETKANVTMLEGIEEDDWDIIVMQQGSAQAGLEETYNEDIQTIIDYVLAKDPTPATKPTFIWNSIWGYPYNADELASNGSTYVTLLKNITGETAANAATQIKMVDMITQAAKDKALTNENVSYVIPSGTAFIRACAALGNNVMYNDYIHASDFGRLMVSYVWYSAITGKTVTTLPDAVPGVLHRTNNGDRPITTEEKAILLDCINQAFTDPYTMPEGFQN